MTSAKGLVIMEHGVGTDRAKVTEEKVEGRGRCRRSRV